MTVKPPSLPALPAPPALPAEFADLEPYAGDWCLATEPERYAKRLAGSMPDMQAFYDAITARAEDAIAYCDRFPIDDLPEDATNLMRLLYSMITVSFPVEVWSQQRVPDAASATLHCVIEPGP
ncbi:hypothetical protein J4573_11455 [Actinomadura barringtoniae]|uniref:Xaa-Pro dipeptidase n=1 Tax=Actinomadura barringtoniae TaxID=1427535 RepID=A0A939P929_9ACTN|nr:hypothetical protein [Actinomadura barringtoniae]MBO2447707.1 hypothetical protein [Actinomadura barringtoniae]